jgi:hypothetical protein
MGPWKIGSAATVAAFGSVAALMASAAIWLAFAIRRTQLPTGLDGTWLWVRDGWGLVWATRLRDRWNAAAGHYGWNMRLSWSGFVHLDADRPPATQENVAAAEQFTILLRRFVDPADWVQVSALHGPPTDYDRATSAGPADSGPPP